MTINYPASLDDDTTIPFVTDTIGHISTTNALRDAIFAIETELGLSPAGTAGSVTDRLSVSFELDGTLKSSAITAMGLVTLPITNTQVSPTAQIAESKLDLDYSTTDLFNFITNQNVILNTNSTFIQSTGSKIEPHLAGSTYRHFLSHIDISSDSSDYFRNKNSSLRNNSNLYTLFNDLNEDYVGHQRSNATSISLTPPPDNYAHFAAGVYLNTSNFSFVPQTATDLQQFCQFIDNSNIFILGTRIQTFYSNGVSRTARASALNSAGDRGQSLVEYTSAICYLVNGGSSTPVDNIDTGDDIIEFSPDAASIANNSFNAKFSLIKIGDIVTVNYGSFVVPSLIKEVKLLASGGSNRYLVRINTKNILAGTFTAKVDKPLFNLNKQGVLALAQANTPTNDLPSLTVGNPRGAQVVGVGFNPDHIDSAHYNLWLTLYPGGNPNVSALTLPPIDVSGNSGATPGKYTLEGVVENVNNAFRQAGYNYRFIAFSYFGEFGIMLADSYGNASFSIVSGMLALDGTYDNNISNTVFYNNVVGTFGFSSSDALGFGALKANVASPPFAATFATPELAQIPMKMFVPLARNNYYVNGIERERFNLEPHQILDGYGDGYWPATIFAKTSVPGTRLEVTYQVKHNLINSRLQVGKTLVVQSAGVVDSGRFFIKDIQFDDCLCDDGDGYNTNITVYDAIHATGSTPFSSAALNTPVSIYFNSDSIGFNKENASDFTQILTPFKRSFELYMNQDGYSFSHERGRMNISGSNITVNGTTLYGDSSLSNINLYKISPKLRGYAYSSVNKINLQVNAYNETTGIFTAYLCKYDGVTPSNVGPTITGKKGSVVRLYDETYVDYIDIILNISDTITTIASPRNIDIQLFPTLSLDDEVMLLGTCQVNDSTKKIQYLSDERQFGNISEKQLSTSALNFISAPNALLNENGIIKGFEVTNSFSGSFFNNIVVKGGTALVNGKIVNTNNETLTIPLIRESLFPAFTTNVDHVRFYLCVNDKGKYDFIPSTDFDPSGSEAATYNGLSLDHNRIFYAKNPNNTLISAYPMRGHYFSDLILNQKDVTPIALIDVFLVTSGINQIINTATSTINDIRRFVSSGFVGLQNPLTLGDNASFRSFDALNNFLKELVNMKSFNSDLNNKISKEVLVKSAITVSSKTFNYNDKIKFKGDGGRFIIATEANLSKNVEFNNLKIAVSSVVGFNILGNDIAVKNCTFDYSYDATADINYTTANLNNPLKACLLSSTTSNLLNRYNIDISFNQFNFSTEYHFPAVSFLVNNETSYHENINISDNKISNSYVTVDDKKGAVSIISTLITTPTVAQGPKFINLNVNNNICDKNQLIIVSATKSVDDEVNNMLVLTNSSISENVCGAICYLSRQDVLLTAINTTLIKNKSNKLKINNNACKYIYNGLSTGFINDNTSRVISLIPSGNELFYGSTDITNNSCSWIQVGLRKPTSVSYEVPVLTISNNRLNASLATYLDSYYDTGLAAINTGLLVDQVTGT